MDRIVANIRYLKLQSLFQALLFILLLVVVNSEWGKILIGPLTVLHFILVISLLFLLFVGRQFIRFRASKQIWLVFFFVLYLHLSSVASGINKIYSYGVLMFFIEFYVIYYFSVLINDVRKVLKLFVATVVIMAAIGLLEFFVGHTFYAREWQGGDRYNEIGLLAIGSTVASTNFMSLVITPTLPLIFYLKRTSNHKLPYNLIVLFLVILQCAGFSRTGVVLMFLGLILVQFEVLLSRRLLYIYFYGLVFLIVIFAVGQINSELFGDLLPTSVQDDGSLAYRSLILFLLGASFLQNPLFGIGYGNFKNISLDLAYRIGGMDILDTNPMNTYLGTMAELGIIGLIFLFIYMRHFIGLTVQVHYNREKLVLRYAYVSLLLIFINFLMIDALFSHVIIVITAIISFAYNRNDYNNEEVHKSFNPKFNNSAL